MNNTSRLISFIALTVSILSSGTARAEEWIKPGEETLKLGIGGFFPAFDTSLRVDRKNIASGGVDLEDDLGVTEEQSTGYAFASWRIAPRHRLGVGYFSFQRDASATALTDIEIGDGETIKAGATTSTNFDMNILPVTYSYSFFKRPEQELALNLGFHWADMEFSVDASAWTEDVSGTGRVSASASLPAPLIGLNYDYWINDKWSLNVTAEYFGFSIGEFDGNIYNVKLGTDYWISNRFGAGLAVNAFGLDIELDDSDWKGSLDYSYWGPQIYLMVRF